MKGAVAAFVCAALKLAPRLAGTAGVVLVITAGEERGCEGANFLVKKGVLPKAGAMVVGEPTSNQVQAGHKGVFWLEGKATGITAHGSMPDKGVNAIYKAARAALALEAFDFTEDAHPVLGMPTLNVGWLRGGINVNSVPDEARLGIDLRIVPGLDRAKLVERLAKATGGNITLEALSTSDPVWTDPADPWMVEVAALTREITGETSPIGGATYFTDAAALKPGMGNPPTVILGPGEPAIAHQTDEFCYVERIGQAEAIYTEVIKRWCGV
jgi:succinyl-diaminopimelate desuccinylase